MQRRLVSILLVLTLVFGLCVPAFAAEDDSTADISAPDIQVEGTSQLGDLLAGELISANSNQKTQRHISNITVSGKKAAVELVTDIACELVVALYDESTGKMTASGNAKVSANATNVSVSLSGDVPTYFVATAYLLDSAGHEPLCEEYSSTLYTQGIQDLEDSTINDYEEDQVVNLDDNPATNFMVYGDDTEVIESTGTTNQLVDHGNGNYTVTNADETFLSLKAGDVFSYSQTDDELLLVKVKSISISGSTLNIVEDKSADINDFFDVIKIDVGADEDEDDIATVANINKELKKTVSVKLGEELIQGSIKTEISVKFKLYTNVGNKYVELKATNKCEFNVSINGKLPPIKYSLADVYFTPFPGLKIGVKLELNLEASGKVSYIATIKKTSGFAYDNGVWVDKSSEPKQDVKVETSVEVKLELVLSPYADFFEIVEVSMGGKVETNISAKMAPLDSEEKRHSCSKCVEGEIKVKGSLFVSLKIAVLEFKKEWSVAQTIAECYYSIDHQEFGWGKCPYISYKISLTVNDASGNPLSNVSVSADSLDDVVTTDENGEVEFYLAKGSHSIELTYGDAHRTEDVYVEDYDRTIVIVFEEVDSPTATPKPPTGQGEVIASGECGQNVTWTLTSDGVFTVSGSGRMDSFMNDAFEPGAKRRDDRPWRRYQDDIKKAVLMEGIKEIPVGMFWNCRNLTEVYIPEGVTYIGNFAFEYTAIESITLPKSLVSCSSTTGNLAFYGANKLKNIYVSDGSFTFESINGVLYSSGGVILYCYPAGREDQSFEVSKNVRIIEDHALYGNKLSTISILNPECSIDDSSDTLGGTSKPVICGYSGSTAEIYATKYGYTFKPLEAKTTATLPEESDSVVDDNPMLGADGNVFDDQSDGMTDIPELPTIVPDSIPEAPYSSDIPEEQPAPEDTTEPTPILPDFLPEEEPMKPQGAIDDELADIELLAAHSPSSVGSNTALFTGLEAGKDYILIVAVNINAVNLLAPDNLLFIAQTAADNSGRIAFAYTPRKNGGTARAYGPGSWTSQSTPPATLPSNGWFTDANGDKYYYKNGKALKGWGYVDAEWYYFDNTGRMVTGDWAQDSRGWYFLGADGKMMSGFREINLGRADDGWYYFNTKHDGSYGRVLSGWQLINGDWYYFNEKHNGTYGRMVTGDWAQDSRGWYFLGADGKMMSGFREINLGRADDGWYYFNTKHDGSYGRVLSGWQLINGDWYYFNEKHNGTYGRMVTSNWAVDSKYWYFLGPDGKMLTGLREINLGRADDGLYYFNTKHDGTYGRMMTGWQTIDGNLYFFETRHNGSFGKAFTNSIWTINGWLCGFDEYGVCYFREYLGW